MFGLKKQQRSRSQTLKLLMTACEENCQQGSFIKSG